MINSANLTSKFSPAEHEDAKAKRKMLEELLKYERYDAFNITCQNLASCPSDFVELICSGREEEGSDYKGSNQIATHIWDTIQSFHLNPNSTILNENSEVSPLQG